MNETQIKELRAHAGKLVAEGKNFGKAFEFAQPFNKDYWIVWHPTLELPDFQDGNEWRITGLQDGWTDNPEDV